MMSIKMSNNSSIRRSSNGMIMMMHHLNHQKRFLSCITTPALQRLVYNNHRHEMKQQHQQLHNMNHHLKNINEHRIVYRKQQSLIHSTNSIQTTTTETEATTMSETTTTKQTKSSTYYDIVIVGGGVVGSTLVKRLHETYPNLLIALIEAGNGPSLMTDYNKDNNNDIYPHPRSYALSTTSMKTLGLFNDNDLDKDGSLLHYLKDGYYTSMQIWEENQPSSLLFTHHDLIQPEQQHEQNKNDNNDDDKNNAKDNTNQWLGCCIEDHVLQRYLWNSFDHNNNNVHIYRQTLVHDFQLPINGMSSGLVQIQLKDNEKSTKYPMNDDTQRQHHNIETKLLIGADGVNSQVRQKSGIVIHDSYDYQQMAMTFTVQLQQKHSEAIRRRAFQRFLHHGPIALLPTWSKNHAVIVWSTQMSDVEYWNHADKKDELIQHLNNVFQTGPQLLESLLQPSDDNVNSNIKKTPQSITNILYGIDKVIETVQYGLAMAVQQGPLSASSLNDDNQCTFQAPPVIIDIVSPIMKFPLKCSIASNHGIINRVALIGDAAHTVHPMAGQGLNLGIQDVEILIQTIQKAINSGMDISTFIHSDYDNNRRIHVTNTVNGIHTLHKLFGIYSQSKEMKHIKSFGMNIIQLMKPLRQLFVQLACQGMIVSSTNSTPSTTTKS